MPVCVHAGGPEGGRKYTKTPTMRRTATRVSCLSWPVTGLGRAKVGVLGHLRAEWTKGRGREVSILILKVGRRRKVARGVGEGWMRGR